jgi:hypothetical protein
MSKKKCNRKVWALINPLHHAMAGASITPRTELDKLLTKELAALNAFTSGKATLKHWHDLAAMNNLTQTLASRGVGPEALEATHRAETALIEAAARFQNTQRMGLTGEGIKAIQDVIEYHDLQRESISRREYEEVIRLTVARVKSGYATIDLDATIGKPKEEAYGN